MTHELVKQKNSSLSYYIPQNLDEWMHVCNMIATSDLCPPIYKNKPNNVFIAAQMGAEVGLNYMQAIQNIAVINGYPSLWGDAALAVVISSPSYDGYKEVVTEESATCTMKRKGREDITHTFTLKDAEKAGLLAKSGPWKSSTKRMLQMRARSFAMRDQFPDALKGINIAEEVQDYEPIEKNITPKKYENGNEVDDEYILLQTSIEKTEDMETLQKIVPLLQEYEGAQVHKNKLRDLYKEKIITLRKQLPQEESNNPPSEQETAE